MMFFLTVAGISLKTILEVAGGVLVASGVLCTSIHELNKENN